jgi:integrase
MATAKKTSSGMWRVRSYSHTDENGIKHYASFTAPTKAQAEQRAAAFNNKKRLRRRNDYTCSEAIQIYIDKLPADISPATLRGYNAIQKRILSHEIASIRINHLSDDELQDFIKEMELEGFSAKTIQSTYSFLMSSIKKYCDQRFEVKLPKIHRPPKNAPSDADVQLLISEADKQLRNAIYLAAFGSLRRGEVAALKYKDINKRKNTITVHSDIVLSPAKEWIHKDHPKTDASYRTVELPKEIIEALGDGQPEDYVITLNPGTISDRFRALKKRLDISIRFHDLRGYCASIMAALGIADTYAQRRGGWSSSGVLKSIYQNVITEHEKQFSAQLNSHFSSLLKKYD